MGKLAEKHLKTNALQAADAFAKHVITKRSDGRWLLQRIHEDGKPESTYFVEVICLAGCALFVGGDIDHVVFAYGPQEATARVRWMGECGDLGYYVRQKARIGSARGQDAIDEWQQDAAVEELRAYLAEREEEEPGYSESEDYDDDYFRWACGSDNQQEFVSNASQAFKHSESEDFYSMGVVLSPAVIYAHAALARLCVLLREEEKAASSEQAVQP